MNFKITHNWLLDYIDTDATPEEIQTNLSLSSVNVETLERVGDDVVYDIEVTSNRIDAASVVGIAMECVAVLPQFGNKATWKSNPLDEIVTSTPQESTTPVENALPLKIEVTDPSLVSRVSAVVLSNVEVRPSPEKIQERLAACGERPINNIVDISNYLRIALGQPVHMFDYDSIAGSHMSICESAAGDVVTLLDGTELELPGNDVIIKDGDGKIIDVVGLMGAQSTEIVESTTRVLFFIPIVDSTRVRSTSMRTGRRTAAITYFEKGLDEERVAIARSVGMNMLMEHAQGIVASDVYDYYPHPYMPNTIHVDTSYVSNLIGADIPAGDMRDMLRPLGFESHSVDAKSFTVKVPSYRSKDVQKQVDVAEEVARMYGYHTIEPAMPCMDTVSQPLQAARLIQMQEDIRNYLSSMRFYEQYNYSMISQSDIDMVNGNVEDHLKISNPISTDLVYMRTSLVPSLINNMKSNKGKVSTHAYFELARAYMPREGELPTEQQRVGIISNESIGYVKGLIENLCSILNLDTVRYEAADTEQSSIYRSVARAYAGDALIGEVAALDVAFAHENGLSGSIGVAELYLDTILKLDKKHAMYQKPNQFAHISLDVTYDSHPTRLYEDIRRSAFEKSTYLQHIRVLNQFNERVTLRLTFAAPDRNLTEAEAKGELEGALQGFLE